MAKDKAFGVRLKTARSEAERLRGGVRLTNREIGERVAKLLGRDEPILSQVVSAWFSAGQEPEDYPRTVAALAKVLGVTPAYLAWGDEQEVTVSQTQDRVRAIVERANKTADKSGRKVSNSTKKPRR